jgi:hypothetical protein
MHAVLPVEVFLEEFVFAVLMNHNCLAIAYKGVVLVVWQKGSIAVLASLHHSMSYG